MLKLRTANLELFAGDGALAQAALDDPARLGRLLDAHVGPYWPPTVMVEAQAHFADVLAGDASQVGWWVWYIVHQQGDVRELVGATGFAGPPDDLGRVQIGYAIIPPYQKRGLATQAARAVIDWALAQPGVQEVVAETYPEMAASLAVMTRCGMKPIGPGVEPGTVRHAVGRLGQAQEHQE